MVQDGKIVAEIPLSFAGEVSTYEGKIELPEAGAYQLEVLAADAGNVNFGQFVQDLTVN